MNANANESYTLLTHKSLTQSVQTLTTMFQKIIALLSVEQFQSHALKISIALSSALQDWVRRLHLEGEWIKLHACKEKVSPKCYKSQRDNKHGLHHLKMLLDHLFHHSSKFQ